MYFLKKTILLFTVLNVLSTIFFNSYLILSGRNWKGTAFGGWKARTEVPKLVQTVMRGEMALEPYITHTYQVQNKAMD